MIALSLVYQVAFGQVGLARDPCPTELAAMNAADQQLYKANMQVQIYRSQTWAAKVPELQAEATRTREIWNTCSKAVAKRKYEQQEEVIRKSQEEADAQIQQQEQNVVDVETIRKADPEQMSKAISAEICRLKSWRMDTLAETRKDQKYARIGGAVDLDQRADWQDQLKSIDDRIERYKGQLGIRGIRGIRRARMATPIGSQRSSAWDSSATFIGSGIERAEGWGSQVGVAKVG